MRKELLKQRLTLGTVALAVVAITACSGGGAASPAAKSEAPASGSAPVAKSAPKVGALHVGAITDLGYNQAMHEGLLTLKSNKGVELIEAENVPESADAERVMENMIQQGATVIFPQSFGYLDPALNVAKRHPEVIFEHPAGFKQSENLGTFWSDTTSMEYLMGIVAGKTSKTGKMGWIIGFPIPNILTSINAFQLGAASVNPSATTQVLVMNGWVDPAKEAEAVNALADSGVDVVTMIVDSPGTIVQTAAKRGIYAVGFHCLCVQSVAGNSWLTGIGFTWGDLFTQIVTDVEAGKWKSANKIGTLDKGYAAIAPYGPAVSADTKALVEQAKADLMSGKLQMFKGPIVDNEGTVRVKEGEVADLGALLGQTDYLVQGASGKIK